ncbi:amino acid permease [Tomitella cavernea]|nr:amino acid permease [Tomitella cavernea]
MIWSMLAACAVVAAVAGAVLPRRARFTPKGLPWFWLVFPATCLVAAWWVGASIGWVGNLGGSARFFWDAFTSAPEGQQFLSNEQFQQMQDQRRLRRVLPAAAAVGAVLSAWAWRKRRV